MGGDDAMAGMAATTDMDDYGPIVGASLAVLFGGRGGGGPYRTAAEVVAAGGDPWGEEAIRAAFRPADLGYSPPTDFADADFADTLLSQALSRYLQAMSMYSATYVYFPHHYRRMDAPALDAAIARVIEVVISPHRATARRAEAVRRLLYAQTHIPDTEAQTTIDAAPNLVVFRNGVLDISTMTLRPGRPEDRMTMALDAVEWRPDAPPGAIDEFLDVLLHEDETTPFLQFIGYAMVAGAPSLEAYLILLGSGENGKSRLMQVLRAMFDGVVTSIPFQRLGDNRFAGAELAGKMINLVGDMSAALVKDTSAIKTLTGGDLITVERKFEAPFTMINKAKSIISTNELFATADHTHGFYRRAYILSFDRNFAAGGADADKRDPRIVERLLADPDTLPRLAYLAIDAYRTIGAGGRFMESQRMIDARAEFRSQNDSVTEFLTDGITKAAPGSPPIPRAAIYRAYRAWAEATGRGAVSERRFWLRWKGAAPPYATVVRPRHGDGTDRQRAIAGIAITDEVADLPVDRREGERVTIRVALGLPTS
jgi:P4 family phage/plasmid primase-like protien